MRNQKLLKIICYCLLLNSIPMIAYPVLTSSQEMRYTGFSIEKKGLTGIVSSEDLFLVSSLRKPETLPQTNDPAKWLIKSETKSDKFLFGLNGKLDLTIYSTNIGEIRDEKWISDDRTLVAFRQSVINKTRKNILLNSI